MLKIQAFGSTGFVVYPAMFVLPCLFTPSKLQLVRQPYNKTFVYAGAINE